MEFERKEKTTKEDKIIPDRTTKYILQSICPILQSNCPITNDKDQATWRKLKIIPFVSKYDAPKIEK